METAAKLRAEAQHLRALSRYVTCPILCFCDL
jgi:hypothetical protein